MTIICNSNTGILTPQNPDVTITGVVTGYGADKFSFNGYVIPFYAWLKRLTCAA